MEIESKYRYSKRAGALQDAFEDQREVQYQQQMPMQQSMSRNALNDASANRTETVMMTRAGTAQSMAAAPAPHRVPGVVEGLDTTGYKRGYQTMFFTTVEDGQRVLVTERSGAMKVVEGPARLWHWGRKVRSMEHYVAHPGEFLIVRYRDGKQEHIAGPAHLWQDPRVHLKINREEALPISAKEAVVVYSEGESGGEVTRRIVYGPATFVPKPGEWLHSFSWHGASPDGRKIPNAMVFQKLWLMPDQMYHDVSDVRTADDAPLTIRLMIFFELIDIEKMLVTTHDPIGDFINAASSDVIEFMSRNDFDSFKKNTEKLNDISTYKQLTGRADQCGYRISKVVYRGYGAPESLQQMHNQAIESRTRLQLQRATEEQAQQLEDYKLERRLARDAKTREEEIERIEHELTMDAQRQAARIEAERAGREFEREQGARDAESQREAESARQGIAREHLDALSRLNVDLTSYLTRGRADRVIELRGGADGAHIHLGAGEG
jgi:regulator of protease activity HflC (stomatin/prohibitin superfamily)